MFAQNYSLQEKYNSLLEIPTNIWMMKNTFVYNQFKEPAYLNLDCIQSISTKSRL